MSQQPFPDFSDPDTPRPPVPVAGTQPTPPGVRPPGTGGGKPEFKPVVSTEADVFELQRQADEYLSDLPRDFRNKGAQFLAGINDNFKLLTSTQRELDILVGEAVSSSEDAALDDVPDFLETGLMGTFSQVKLSPRIALESLRAGEKSELRQEAATRIVDTPEYQEVYSRLTTIKKRLQKDQLLLLFWEAIPKLWITGDTDSVEEAFVNLFGEEEAKEIQSTLSPNDKVNLLAMFRAVANSSPRWLDDASLQEVTAALAMKPQPNVTFISNQTVEQIVDALATRARPTIPQGFTQEQYLNELRRANADPELLAELDSAREFYKKLGEDYLRSREQADAVLLGLLSPEIPRLSGWDSIKLTVYQPALVTAESMEYFFRHVSRPILGATIQTGTAPLAMGAVGAGLGSTLGPIGAAAGGLIGFTTGALIQWRNQSDISKLYNFQRSQGVGVWPSLNYAVENWDQNMAIKLIAETMTDPLTLFGLGIYSKALTGAGARLPSNLSKVTYAGNWLGATEQAYMQFWDEVFKLPFRALSKIPMTPAIAASRQAISGYTHWVRLARQWERFGPPGTVGKGRGAGSLRMPSPRSSSMLDSLEYAVDRYLKVPAGVVQIDDYAQLGKKAIEGAYRWLDGPAIITSFKSGSRAIGRKGTGLEILHPGVGDDISPQVVMDVNRILVDSIGPGRLYSRAEAAAHLASILGKGTADDVKNAKFLISRWRRGLRTKATAPARVEDPVLATRSFSDQLRNTFLANIRSPVYKLFNGQGKASAFQNLLAKNDRFAPLLAANWVDKNIVYPFSRSVLLFLNYGFYNVLENTFRLGTAGVPLRPNQATNLLEELYFKTGHLKATPPTIREVAVNNRTYIAPVATVKDPTTTALGVDLVAEQAAGRIPGITMPIPEAVRRYMPIAGDRVGGFLEKKLPQAMWSLNDLNAMYSRYTTLQQTWYHDFMYEKFLRDEAPHIMNAIGRTVGDMPTDVQAALGSSATKRIGIMVHNASLVGPDAVESLKSMRGILGNSKLLQDIETIATRYPDLDSAFWNSIHEGVRVGSINLENLGSSMPAVYATWMDTTMVGKAYQASRLIPEMIAELREVSFESAEELARGINAITGVMRTGTSMAKNASDTGTIRSTQIVNRREAHKFMTNVWQTVDSISNVLDQQLDDAIDHVRLGIRSVKTGERTDLLAGLTDEQEGLYIERLKLMREEVNHLLEFDGPRRAESIRHRQVYIERTMSHEEGNTLMRNAWDQYNQRRAVTREKMSQIDLALARTFGDTAPRSGIRPPIGGGAPTISDVASMYDGAVDDLLRNLVDSHSMTMKSRDEFILEHMARATTQSSMLNKQPVDFGMTPESLGDIYDSALRSISFDPSSSTFDQPMKQVFKGIEDDMRYAFMASALDPDVDRQFVRYLQNTAEGLRRTGYFGEIKQVELTPYPNVDLRNTKVVDLEGKAKTLYHGTSTTFQDFDDHFASSSSMWARGHHFTENADIAGEYAGKETSREVADHQLFGTLDEAQAFADALEKDPLIVDVQVGPMTNQPEYMTSWVIRREMQPQVRVARLDLQEPFRAHLSRFGDSPVEEQILEKIPGNRYFLREIGRGPDSALGEPLAPGSEGVSYQIVDSTTGLRIGDLEVQTNYGQTPLFDSDALLGEFIGAEGLGTSGLRDISEDLASRHPTANRIVGDRISGAREISTRGRLRTPEVENLVASFDLIRSRRRAHDKFARFIDDLENEFDGRVVDSWQARNIPDSLLEDPSKGLWRISTQAHDSESMADISRQLNMIITTLRGDLGKEIAESAKSSGIITGDTSKFMDDVIQVLEDLKRGKFSDLESGGIGRITPDILTNRGSTQSEPLAYAYEILDAISDPWYDAVTPRRASTDVLDVAGFDSLLYDGGRLSPGTPQHDVWVAFHADSIHPAFDEIKTASTFQDIGPTPDFLEAQERAMTRTTEQFRIDFPDYANQTAFDSTMRRIYPYWTYEFQRWPWLMRHAVKTPGIFASWGRYVNNTDTGYIHIPGTSLEINPTRGTVFMGGLRRLYVQDYPEFADEFGMPVEVLDFVSRAGFYPNVGIMAPIAYFGARSQGTRPQLGEILPPLAATALGILGWAFPDSTASRILRDNIFNDRYRTFRIASMIDEYGGDGSTIIGKRREDIPLTTEEGDYYSRASRYVDGISGVLDSQFGLFRIRGPKKLEMLSAIQEIRFQLTGVSPDDQKKLRLRTAVTGQRFSDIFPMDPWEQFISRELLDKYERQLSPNIAPLLPSLMGEVQFKVQEYYNELERLFTSARTEGFFRTDSITGQSIQTHRPVEELDKDWREGTISASEYKSALSQVMGHAVEASTELGKQARYKDIPKTRFEREQYFQKHNIPMPTWNPGQELIWEYYNIRPDLKLDPDDGVLRSDFNGMFAKLDLLLDSLHPSTQPRLLAKIQSNWTEGQVLYWQKNREFIRGYKGVREAVLKDMPEPEQEIIRQYHKADAAVRQELRAIENEQGRIISQYDTTVGQIRENLRLLSPELDAWLLFWGETSNVLTEPGRLRYNELLTQYRPGVQHITTPIRTPGIPQLFNTSIP